MPFEIPGNIHPNTARLAWLIGTWAGNGHGEYPGIEKFQFGQEVVFQQDGRPFIHYFSRWITPLGAPRRYDTRFFVALAPGGQTPLHDDREVIANLWIRPEDALEQHAAGRFELIFPTVRSLEALMRFEVAAAVIEHAAGVESIDPILPRIVEDSGSLRIVLPGDEVYDATTSRRLS